MYWILMSERSDEHELSVDALPPTLVRLGLRFDEGRRVASPVPRFEIPCGPCSEERLTDNVVAPTRMGLLVNDKLKTLFSDFGASNIQYFPVIIRGVSSGDMDGAYWIANIIGTRACIDREASELSFFDDGQIEFIDRLALKVGEGAAFGHIFRIDEFPSLVVIHDELKSRLQEASVTGVKFYKPEEFSL